MSYINLDAQDVYNAIKSSALCRGREFVRESGETIPVACGQPTCPLCYGLWAWIKKSMWQKGKEYSLKDVVKFDDWHETMFTLTFSDSGLDRIRNDKDDPTAYNKYGHFLKWNLTKATRSRAHFLQNVRAVIARDLGLTTLSSRKGWLDSKGNPYPWRSFPWRHLSCWEYGLKGTHRLHAHLVIATASPRIDYESIKTYWDYGSIHFAKDWKCGVSYAVRKSRYLTSERKFRIGRISFDRNTTSIWHKTKKEISELISKLETNDRITGNRKSIYNPGLTGLIQLNNFINEEVDKDGFLRVSTRIEDTGRYVAAIADRYLGSERRARTRRHIGTRTATKPVGGIL